MSSSNMRGSKVGRNEGRRNAVLPDFNSLKSLQIHRHLHSSSSSLSLLRYLEAWIWVASEGVGGPAVAQILYPAANTGRMCQRRVLDRRRYPSSRREVIDDLIDEYPSSLGSLQV